MSLPFMEERQRPSDSPALPPSPSSKPDGTARQSWRSEELLGERAEVLILHNDEVYRLRRTRQGKLILYK
jgi:hemin uptake protein HemP